MKIKAAYNKDLYDTSKPIPLVVEAVKILPLEPELAELQQRARRTFGRG